MCKIKVNGHQLLLIIRLWVIRLPHQSIHRYITPGQILVDDRPYRRRTIKLYTRMDPYRYISICWWLYALDFEIFAGRLSDPLSKTILCLPHLLPPRSAISWHLLILEKPCFISDIHSKRQDRLGIFVSMQIYFINIFFFDFDSLMIIWRHAYSMMFNFIELF